MASETQHDAACQCGHASAEHDAKRGGVCLTRSGYCGCARFVAGATAQDAEAAEVIAQMRRTGGQPYDAHDLRCIARALAAARAEERERLITRALTVDLVHTGCFPGSREATRENLIAAMRDPNWSAPCPDDCDQKHRARGNESGVADPTRGDAAGEQAQPPQHRDAAGKPADSSGARASAPVAAAAASERREFHAHSKCDVCEEPVAMACLSCDEALCFDHAKVNPHEDCHPDGATVAELREALASGCRCGHDESLHVERRGRLECTVCVCNAFDWEMPPEKRTLTDESVHKMLSQIKPRHLLGDRHTGIVPLQALHSLLSEVRASRSAAKRAPGLSAEVARLREENDRLTKRVAEVESLAADQVQDKCASWDKARALAEVLRRALRDSGCDGELCMHQWHEDARRLLPASDKPPITHPAPPASEPTREALLAALKECYRLASDGHFLEHGSACEATAIQIVAARALAGLATEKDVAAWSNEHPRIAAERAALAAAKESR